MIDLHKLHIFHTVAQEGSFSAAAKRLYITQSAVSQHMKDLEASLGQTLFRRGWRGVQLTPSGDVLADYARRVFDLLAQAEDVLVDVGQIERGKISLGATPGVAVYLAPNWVQQFRTFYPRLTIALNTGVTGQIVADVLAHRIDLGIIEGELDELSHHRLLHLVLESVEQMVVVGFKHPLWDAPIVKPVELNRQSFIVRQQNSQSRIWLERTLKRHGIEPMISAEFDNLESMKRAVAAGTCLAVLPPYVVQSEVEQHLLRRIPVEGQPFIRDMKLIWDRELHWSPVVRAFTAYLSEQYPGLKSTLRDKQPTAT